jgi:N-acetyl-anhydromuramoyl-L-alanine amidase
MNPTDESSGRPPNNASGERRPEDPRTEATSGDNGAAMLPDWGSGWLRSAVARPSPNHGPRPPGARITLAVVHSISLPPGQFGGDAIEQLFMNQLDCDAHPYFAQIRGLQVSSHFLIRRGGELLQFVSCDDRAWHAGPSSWRGRPDCNDYSIGIELEGLEGESFEAPQYRVLADVLAQVAGRYGMPDVAGHEHVAPGRKHDPGAGFNWPRLMTTLGWPPRCFPADLVPPE